MVTQLSNAVITFLFNIILLDLAGENGVAAITILLYGQFLFNGFYLGFSIGISPIVGFFKFRIFCLFIKTFIHLVTAPSNLPRSDCCHSDAHHSGSAPPVPSFSPAASPHMFFELSLFHYPGTHFNIISGVIYRVFQFLYFMLRHRNPPL